MWDLINGENTLKDVADELCAAYGAVSREKLETDLEEFVTDMKKIKAIK